MGRSRGNWRATVCNERAIIARILRCQVYLRWKFSHGNSALTLVSFPSSSSLSLSLVNTQTHRLRTHFNDRHNAIDADGPDEVQSIDTLSRKIPRKAQSRCAVVNIRCVHLSAGISLIPAIKRPLPQVATARIFLDASLIGREDEVRTGEVAGREGAVCTTAGRINCCDYFKISGRVYAAVRHRETRPTAIPFIPVCPSFFLVSSLFPSVFFFLPFFSFFFISFHFRRTSPRPFPRTYKPERAHKLSLLRAPALTRRALLNSGLLTDAQDAMSVNEWPAVMRCSPVRVYESRQESPAPIAF